MQAAGGDSAGGFRGCRRVGDAETRGGREVLAGVLLVSGHGMALSGLRKHAGGSRAFGWGRFEGAGA